MAQIPLKISNIQGNELELISRLKGINTPWKKTLLKSLENRNWLAFYQDLLYRIEFWSEKKVLNYTKQDLNLITNLTRKVGLLVVAEECVKKYVTSPDQAPVPVQVADAKMDEVTYFPDAYVKTEEETEEQKALELVKECADEVFPFLKLQFVKLIRNGELKSWKNLFDISFDGLTFFQTINPTDIILKATENKKYQKMVFFVFEDGEEFVEKVLEILKEKFEILVENSKKPIK